MTESSTGGRKGQKLARFDLIPTGPLVQLAQLYGRGAEKYEVRNWEKGYEWSNSYAAAMRHLVAFWAGEDLDPELDLPHPVMVIFHMMALLQFMEQHPEFDDRPTTSEERIQARLKAVAMEVESKMFPQHTLRDITDA
jgi:hypothetical protein